MWQILLINSALTLIGRLVQSGVIPAISGMATQLISEPRLSNESDAQYNDRRRAMVIESIKAAWPGTRTALIDAALGLIVARMKA